MKLVRYLHDGEVLLGAVAEDAIMPVRQFRTMIELIDAGPEALDSLRDDLTRATPELKLAEVHLLAPVERPGKYLAIGMNYGKHLEEAGDLGVPRPSHQVWFNKQTTCIAGPYDSVERGVTEKLDYEVELGAVIGRRAKKVSRAAAPDHVFGFLVANDISARDWQFHSNTITMGKSFDTHGPIGPWIVTSDEVPDPHALDLRCFVNGELRQSSNTREMLADLWDQIEYLSTAFTLEPGDLIATGTPEGVGVAMKPQVFLQPGDVVRCEIDGIGNIENKIIA